MDLTFGDFSGMHAKDLEMAWRHSEDVQLHSGWIAKTRDSQDTVHLEVLTRGLQEARFSVLHSCRIADQIFFCQETDEPATTGTPLVTILTST